MTPLAQAKHLISQFPVNSRQSAIICVNQITYALQITSPPGTYDENYEINYWSAVIDEILALPDPQPIN